MAGSITRVLHFAQEGDTSGFFPQLARWHNRARYRMFFATLNPMEAWLQDYMQSQGVETFSCDSQSRAKYPLAALNLARFLRRNEIDILHTHLFEPSVIGLLAGVLARTPLRVMTRHYSDYHTRINKRWHVGIDRLCTRLSGGVIAVSRHTADHMIAEEAAPPDKLHVVLNGIDFDRVKISSMDLRERVRREFGAEDAHLLLIAARLHPEKGYEYLFQSLPELKRRLDRRLLVLVAGKGPFEREYRQTVRSLGCESEVRFLGFRNDLPELMAASDLFVLPSVAEAFGLVLAESLYIGTPVVATRVGGIPEIVDDGVDGVLVPTADSRALADAIIDLLQDPQRRNQMAGAGRKKVISRFSFEDMVRSYERLYAHLSAVGDRIVQEGVSNSF
jgi:glycosyltransferase involved in cell wall biosynthesis